MKRNVYREKSRRVAYKKRNRQTADRNNETVSSRKIINYIINISMLVSIIVLFVTGLIKYSPIQSLLSIEVSTIPYTAISTVHDLSGISMLVLGIVHIILHFKVMLKTTKSIFNKKIKSIIAIIIAVLVLVAAVTTALTFILKDANQDKLNDVHMSSKAIELQTITIQGVGEFSFNPEDIVTLRSDLFSNGEFSVFDIIANLDRDKQIYLEYHFDDSIDSYVIDSINGIEKWWFIINDIYDVQNKDKLFMDEHKYNNEYSYKLINISNDEFLQVFGILDSENEDVPSINEKQELLELSEKTIEQLIKGKVSQDIIIELENAGYNRETIDLIKTVVQTEPQYKDGTYIGSADAHNGAITVEVTIENGKISYIRVLEHSETAPDLPEVFNLLPFSILKNQSTEDVDTISGATEASDGYIAAVEDALKQARKDGLN